MSEYPNLAVLTGDIVKSTQVDPDLLDAGFTALETAMAWFQDHHGGQVWFTRFRGDGWQIAVTPAPFAPYALFLAWAALGQNGLHTRVSLAMGQGHISDDGLNAAHGQAFLQSGHGLEAMASATLHTDASCPASWQAALPALTFIAQNWTQKQALVCAHALRQWPEKQNASAIARSLGSTRQSIQKHLESAGYDAFEAALTVLYPQ